MCFYWAPIAAFMMLVVTPRRRATAQGLSLLASHLFGDAASPVIVGQVVDMILAGHNCCEGCDKCPCVPTSNGSGSWDDSFALPPETRAQLMYLYQIDHDIRETILIGRQVVTPTRVQSPVPQIQCTTQGCRRCANLQGGYVFRWFHERRAATYDRLLRADSLTSRELAGVAP